MLTSRAWVQHTMQHLSSMLHPTNMGHIAREHVTVACRELSNREEQVVKEDEKANEDKEADGEEEAEAEEAKNEIPLLGLVEPILHERRFNLRQQQAQGITIKQQDEGPSQVYKGGQIGRTKHHNVFYFCLGIYKKCYKFQMLYYVQNFGMNENQNIKCRINGMNE